MGQTTRLTSNQTAAWLLERDGFLLLTHRRPDGDTLGSAAGLCVALRQLGKTAYLLENPDTTARYAGYVAAYLAPAEFQPQTVLAMDTADRGILQVNAGPYLDKIDLAIDHHASYTDYAAHACLDTAKAACGEVAYDVILALNTKLTAEIATPLYVAITTDTGCFQYANTTADTLCTASALIRAGAEHWAVNKTLFRTKSRARVAFDGAFLAGLRYHYNDRVAIAVVTRAMMAETGVTEDDLDDIAAIPGQVEGVKVGIVVKELAVGRCKVSVRTTPGFSANQICQTFGGGGHPLAAGCEVHQPPDETAALLLQACEEQLV